jgi:hypothetical protein
MFTALLKQIPLNDNHFEYKTLEAFTVDIDIETRMTAINHWMDYHKQHDPTHEYMVFNLETIESVIGETVIGRIVTTKQLLDILQTDEFTEQITTCSLLFHGIIFNLETIEPIINETIIGRIVTTKQLDEFTEETATCSLLPNGINITHFIYIGDGIVFDTSIDENEEEDEWRISEFQNHYKDSLWRIQE